MTNVMPTYNRYPVSFVRGEGSYLIADDGKRYLDGLAGIAVCVLGHSHPGVATAIANQANTLIHTSNLYGIPEQEKLACRLCELSRMDRVFFGNSGAEANEAALKLARKYGHDHGVEVPVVVVMDGSFHGRTMSTLSATGNRKVQAGFEPLVSGFARVPYNDIVTIEQIAEQNHSVVAILVEPILGEGGIVIPDDSYLPELRRVCDENNWLLMLDEVQTGNGRTGKFFAFQHSTIMPDVVTTAKGLANGVPIGACLTRDKANDVLVAGTHASTFGGNPLVCAAANVVLDELTNGVIDQAVSTGQYMLDSFTENLKGLNHVVDIRGKGMMIAIQLAEPCTDLVNEAIDRGLLLNVTADSVVRLLPPLNFTRDEANEAVKIVTELVTARK